MRFFAFILAGLLVSTAPALFVAAHAQTQDLPLENQAPPSQPELPDEDALKPQIDDVPLASEDTRSESDRRLDQLFSQLKKTRNEKAARQVANRIWSEWFRSGSASIDLMMHWSNEAVERSNFNIALDYLDQVVTRKPDYAEGWNRRATLHFNMSNYNKSMADIQKVLELEPRHFGALSGMATILERSGKKEAALSAWERALSVYPAMKNGQSAYIRLSDELEGDPA